MKKLLLLLFSLVLFQVNAQKINKDGNGYFEVYKTKLTIKETNAKVTQWIAENYDSAKNVTELNSESRIILKGNFPLTLAAPIKAISDVHKTLTISFRDGRYKIELIPTKMTYNGTDLGDYFKNQFITENIYSEDEFLKLSIKTSFDSFIAQGYSKKKAQKMINKYVIPDAKINYSNYLINKKIWDNTIASIFYRIKNYVESSEDDW